MGYVQLLLLVTVWLVVLLVPISASFGNLKPAATNHLGFISIDCGVDQDYLDEETGIFYKSDTDFISTGENQDISPDYYYYSDNEIPNFRRLFQNVRFFSEGRKNCYKLPPEQGKNHNYLVRVFFKYGNYDAKNQIPRFDLYLGVNYWATVQPQNASEFLMSEIIHFSLTETIDVCLVNTGSGIPFISALELRHLNDSIYRIVSRELSTLWRLDLGNSTNQYLRYRDDVYDRIWVTYTEYYWISVNTTADIDILGSNNSYKLPVQLWRTAVQPPASYGSLMLSMSPVPATELYVCFHFVEILQVRQGQRRREFNISLNGVNYGPITLEYLKPLSICPPKLPIQGSLLIFIIPTKRSDLPPILNGLEIFKVIKHPNSPTDPADVDSIMAIKEIYKLNKDDNWQGDPCIPRDFTWSGLNCSYDTNPPRIISLNLSSNKLTGMISSSFSKLKVIQSLDLSYNELTGQVPEFLAELPNLTILNLTGNKLRGPIPQSLAQKSNNGTLQLSLDGNPNLCQTDYCEKKKRSSILPIVISVVAVSVLLLFSSMMIFCRKKKRGTATQSNKEGSVIPKNRLFSYAEIVSITDNFKTIVGEGGFGKVYLGTLKDSTQVAVKLLSQNSRQGYKEFQAEAQLLMIVHHRNLVSLIGYCDDHHNKALIYEYMVYGNLREHLSDTSGSILNWDERLQIAVDAAHGLEYLHNGCKPPIVHRDLKTSNILINDKLQAKIADFGLSRAFKNESGSHITTHPAGTYGYLDPEAQASGNFSQKSDVYSFGIILLELITGQPAIKRDMMTGNIILIQQWVTPIIERGDIQSLIDPRLQGQFDTNSAWKVVETALTCVLNSAIQRPDMSHVLAELKECLAMVRSFGSSQRMEIGRTRSLAIDTEMVPSPR